MPDRQAVTVVCCALVPMSIILVRPSSGMRIVVFGLLLAAMALLRMSIGLRDVIGSVAGTD